MHFNRETHSPRSFEAGHGAEVDIWAVGQLIVEANKFVHGVPAEFLDIGRMMIREETMTARDALDAIKLSLDCVISTV